MKPKIAVALSGGVDSAVAAHILKSEGYDVIGIYMKNWSSRQGLLRDACPWVQDREDAIAVAAHLGIPFVTADFEEQYRKRIYHYFVSQYSAGRTPNPDVLCNNLIKFDLLLDYARSLGAEKLATGHYATLTQDADGTFNLMQGTDPAKDQSYFLHRLDQSQLAAALFPLGKLTKTAVRKLAHDAKLPNAAKKDSQGLCFVGKISLSDFLAQEIVGNPGPILDLAGNKIGEHQGAAFYTVGQRRGIGVAAPEPLYVIAANVEANTITVGHESALYQHEVRLDDLHWISGEDPVLPLNCAAQVRYHAEKVPATLHPDGTLQLDEPQRALASGQFAVLFAGDRLLGGGVMDTKITAQLV